MKKRTKIILIILLVIAVAIAIVGIVNRKTISAVYMTMRYDSDELYAKMEEKQEENSKKIVSYFPDGVRDYTDEEKQSLEGGEVTKPQLLAKIMDEKFKKFDEEEAQMGELPAVSKQEQIISKYASQMYSLEGEYTSGIEGVLSTAYEYYKSIATHNDDVSAILATGAEYSGRIYSLEGDCDAKVDTLLANMKSELEQNGCDTSVISTMRSAYENEKSSKRAYYMSKYGMSKYW